jgi:hypothetical protein
MPDVHAGSGSAADAREAGNGQHLHGAFIVKRASPVKLRGAKKKRLPRSQQSCQGRSESCEHFSRPRAEVFLTVEGGDQGARTRKWNRVAKWLSIGNLIRHENKRHGG